MNWFGIVASGDLDLISSLLPTFATSRDKKNRTALMLSAARNLIPQVALLAPYEATLQDLNGFTASHYGAIRGYFYPELSSELNITSNTNLTSLMLSSLMGTNTSKFLAERNKISSQGYTATQAALFCGNFDAAMKIGEKTGEISNLMAAATSEEEIGRNEQFLHQIDKSGRTALWFALDAGNEKMAAKLTILGDISDNSGTTPLMKAAEAGITSLVQALINQKNTVNNSGKTALMFACEKNHLECAKLLFSEAKMQDNNGKTASMYAAENGSVDCLALTIAEESVILDTNNQHIMHYCVKGGIGEGILSQIVQNFQNNVDSSGKSSLGLACEIDNFAATQYLLKYESAVLGPNGETPSMYAAVNNSVNSIELVALQYKKLRNNAGKLAIDLALENDSGKVIPVLLEKDPAENILLRACAENKFQTVKIISDVARFGSSALTPFVYSVKQQKICQQQLHQLTKKFLKFSDNLTALFVAIQAGASESVRILLPSLQNLSLKDGTTPLMFYAKTNNFLDSKCRQALIKANQGKQMKDGSTALMLACFSGENKKLIHELGKYEISLLDKNGKSALDFAQSAGDFEIVDFLKGLK